MTDILLIDGEVAQRLGVSKATVWRRAAAGIFPKPVRLGASSRWPASDVQAAIDKLIAQRDETAV